MATVALSSNTVITDKPFLIRRLACTGGSTSAALTHGESRSPDLVIPVSTDVASPAHTGISVVRNTSATTLTAVTVVDSADTFDLYCIWYSQASGGLTALFS